jgi:hypothetical protein
MLQVTGRVQVVGWFFIITGSLIPVFWIQLYLCNPWQAFEESCQKSIILPICIPDKYGF